MMNNFTIQTNRDGRIDSLKGFLILLVVVGHVIGETGASIIPFWKGMRIFIYLFHMPLFVLISGIFAKQRDNFRDLVFSLKGLIVPLLIFQVINLILLFFLRREEFSFSYLIVPYWTLWYLLSLIFWRLLLQYTPKVLLSMPLLYVFIAIAISLICGLLPHGRILSLQRTFCFYPFFLIGYFLGQYQTKIQILFSNNWIKVAAFLSIVIIAALVSLNLLPTNSGTLLLGADQYGVTDLLPKAFLMFLSLIMSISLFFIAIDIPVLHIMGKDSLFFYIYHCILLQFVFIPIIAYLGIPVNSVLVLTLTLLITFVLFIMSKMAFFKRLVKPQISNLKK